MSKFNPLAPILQTAVHARNWLYDHSLLAEARLKIPVISVGNITMGGTGKTPFIHWLIGELKDLGYRPGVASRSYGAKLRNSEWVHTEPGSYAVFGDEAVLLKLKNPTVPILSGPQKWVSALKLERESSETNVVLIDDGFQHRRLHRDFNIVLLDASVSLKDYEWPPVGRARETIQSLRRAQVIVFTRWEQRNEETVEFLKNAHQYCDLVLNAEQEIEPLRWIAGRPIKDVEPLKSGTALAFCGLGNPSSFLKSLENQGLKIGEFMRFPDHADYDELRIRHLVESGAKFDYVVTSEKDMVKLQNWPFNGPSLCVTPMRLKISGSLEAFRAKLSRSLWTNT
jgi:tetraacyldisaccharide 4'-kinase